jgi:hypothetical protein
MEIRYNDNSYHYSRLNHKVLSCFNYHRMTRNHLIVPIACILLLSACVSSRITTAWKNEHPSPFPYHKIMVAAAIKEQNDSLRLDVEKQVAARLNSLGYYAVSAAEEFGRFGLKELSEEATYLSLCDNGIDAVLTIALVPDSSTRDLREGGAKKFTNLYYYNHIWNYRNLKNNGETIKLRWEMILFDITQLQPQFVLQAGPFPNRQARVKVTELAKQAISKLAQNNTLLKKDSIPMLKPF